MACITNIMSTASYENKYPDSANFWSTNKKKIGVIKDSNMFQLIGFNSPNDSDWDLGPIESNRIKLFGKRPVKGKSRCGLDYGP